MLSRLFYFQNWILSNDKNSRDCVSLFVMDPNDSFVFSKHRHQVPEGCTCLANIPSTDESAFCMWSMPVGSTEEEFQTMIDGFAKPCTNEVFQVDTNISSGLRSFHPDVFAAELYAGAKAMIAGSGK